MSPRVLGDDRGSVVAEFAIALPAVALVLLLGSGALGAAATHVRLQDAAADAARLASRGDAALVPDVVGAAVAGATAVISDDGDLVCVRTTAGAMLGVTLTASSCALSGGR